MRRGAQGVEHEHLTTARGGDRRRRGGRLLRGTRDQQARHRDGIGDVVKTALEAEGVNIDFWKVKIKPGKPLAFGRREGAFVLGLPGNPVSAQRTLCLFGLPLLRALQGDAEDLRRWWDGVAAILQPLEGALTAREAGLDAMIATHLQAAHLLACDHEQSCALWSGTAGGVYGINTSGTAAVSSLAILDSTYGGGIAMNYANAGIPVIMLTSRGQNVTRDEAEHSGAALYVTKPFSPNALAAEARRIIAESAPSTPSEGA